MSKKGHTNNPEGRPPKKPGESIRQPARQFGRVSEDEWTELQSAAKSSGKSFTKWALEILLRAARRLRRGR